MINNLLPFLCYFTFRGFGINGFVLLKKIPSTIWIRVWIKNLVEPWIPLMTVEKLNKLLDSCVCL